MCWLGQSKKQPATKRSYKASVFPLEVRNPNKHIWAMISYNFRKNYIHKQNIERLNAIWDEEALSNKDYLNLEVVFSIKKFIISFIQVTTNFDTCDIPCYILSNKMKVALMISHYQFVRKLRNYWIPHTCSATQIECKITLLVTKVGCTTTSWKLNSNLLLECLRVSRNRRHLFIPVKQLISGPVATVALGCLLKLINKINKNNDASFFAITSMYPVH